jgi:hypothetical protein
MGIDSKQLAMSANVKFNNSMARYGKDINFARRAANMLMKDRTVRHKLEKEYQFDDNVAVFMRTTL